MKFDFFGGTTWDQPGRSRRIGVVDALRFLSIVLVVVGHCPIPLKNRGSMGLYGVCIFFVLSGYLITRWIGERETDFFRMNVRNFYAMRAARILPLLCAVVLFGLYMVSFHDLQSAAGRDCLRISPAHFNAQFLISIFTFWFNWFRIYFAPEMLWGLHWAVLWSLAIEEQFYFCYPLLIRACKTRGNYFYALFCFILMGPIVRWVAYAHMPRRTLMIMFNSFAAFDLIATGCLLYFVSGRIRPFLKKYPVIQYALLAAGAALTMGVVLHGNLRVDMQRSLTPSLLALGVSGCILGGEGLAFFGSIPFRQLCYPGQLTYGMYLFHSSVIYFLWDYIHRTSQLQACLTVVLATIAVAWLSFVFYETPGRRLLFQALTRKPRVT